MIWPNSSGTVLTHILSQDDQHVLLKSATFMGMWTLIYTVAGNHKNQPYKPNHLQFSRFYTNHPRAQHSSHQISQQGAVEIANG